MQTQEPTTLYVPAPTTPTRDAGLSPLAWGAAIVPVLVGIVWLALLAKKRSAMPPEEHAFRSLSRRMRLQRAQVAAIRRCARESRCEPVQVLMDESLLSRALGS